MRCMIENDSPADLFAEVASVLDVWRDC